MADEPLSCGFCRGPLNGSEWSDFDTGARICEECATEVPALELTMEQWERWPDMTIEERWAIVGSRLGRMVWD
jgi:hypothetical protein